MKKLKTLSANQPLASTHKKSQSLVCPHCGFIGKRAAGFANHLRACRRRHGDEPTPTPSPDEAASEQQEQEEARARHANTIDILEDTIDILEDTRRLAGDQITLSLPIIVLSPECRMTESPEC
jgi:hypothetical protein